MIHFDYEDKRALESLSDTELAQFLTKKAVNAKKDLERKVFVETQAANALAQFDHYLKDQPAHPGDRETRILDDIEFKQKQIKVIDDERDRLQKEVDMFELERKEKALEKNKA